MKGTKTIIKIFFYFDSIFILTVSYNQALIVIDIEIPMGFIKLYFVTRWLHVNLESKKYRK